MNQLTESNQMLFAPLQHQRLHPLRPLHNNSRDQCTHKLPTASPSVLSSSPPNNKKSVTLTTPQYQCPQETYLVQPPTLLPMVHILVQATPMEHSITPPAMYHPLWPPPLCMYWYSTYVNLTQPQSQYQSYMNEPDDLQSTKPTCSIVWLRLHHPQQTKSTFPAPGPTASEKNLLQPP